MREVTLAEVRELLSSPAATRFFEAWGRASTELANLTERRDMLMTQVHAAESRVVFAQETARQASLAADRQRRRALEVASSSAEARVVPLEAEALAGVHQARAQAALDEAHARRLRASSLSDEVRATDAQVEACRQALRPLKQQARLLGAQVGESCLFFADAARPNGVFLVPLERLSFEGVQLDAYVLYRHPGQGSLALSEPVRDVRQVAAPVGGDDLASGDEDAFATPSEAPGARARP